MGLTLDSRPIWVSRKTSRKKNTPNTRCIFFKDIKFYFANVSKSSRIVLQAIAVEAPDES